MDEDLPGSAPGGWPVRRLVPVVVACIAVGAVLAPVFRSPAPDGFPLSTYPMFARDRGDDTWVDVAIGRDADGAVVRLSSALISGSDEPVLAASTVSRAVADGSTEELCAAVARRVVDSGRSDISAVEVVSERHDLDRFAPDEPLLRRRHARCDVAV